MEVLAAMIWFVFPLELNGQKLKAPAGHTERKSCGFFAVL
jgi:hypothetical protein